MIGTSPKWTILAATNGIKRMLRGVSRSIHPSAWRNCLKSSSSTVSAVNLTGVRRLESPEQKHSGPS